MYKYITQQTHLPSIQIISSKEALKSYLKVLNLNSDSNAIWEFSIAISYKIAFGVFCFLESPGPRPYMEVSK